MTSLKSPTFTRLQEKFKIFELCANDYDIISNVQKKFSEYVGYISSIIHDTVNLVMRNRQTIQCVYICSRLGNTLCSTNKNALSLNTVNDLYCRVNNILADFPHYDCKTLSVLFRTHCINVYGSQIWAYSKYYLNEFYTTWKKAIRRICKQPANS